MTVTELYKELIQALTVSRLQYAPAPQLTLCIQETPKRVLKMQTVKTQMKCNIILHFTRVFTVYNDKKDLQTK